MTANIILNFLQVGKTPSAASLSNQRMPIWSMAPFSERRRRRHPSSFSAAARRPSAGWDRRRVSRPGVHLHRPHLQSPARHRPHRQRLQPSQLDNRRKGVPIVHARPAAVWIPLPGSLSRRRSWRRRIIESELEYYSLSLSLSLNPLYLWIFPLQTFLLAPVSPLYCNWVIEREFDRLIPNSQVEQEKQFSDGYYLNLLDVI